MCGRGVCAMCVLGVYSVLCCFVVVGGGEVGMCQCACVFKGCEVRCDCICFIFCLGAICIFFF